MAYALIGWLSPFAVFGLYSLVHFCRPRRPMTSTAMLRKAAPVSPLGVDGQPVFFVEVARRTSK